MREPFWKHRWIVSMTGPTVAAVVVLFIYPGYWLPPAITAKAIGALAPGGGLLAFAAPDAGGRNREGKCQLVIGRVAGGAEEEFHLEFRLRARGRDFSEPVHLDSTRLRRTSLLDVDGITGYILPVRRPGVSAGRGYEIEYSFREEKTPAGLTLWMVSFEDR